MSTTLRISEAASIALHSMSYLAANHGRLVTSREIISSIRVSDAHLMKVLQRLVKAGLIKSIRGPNGGFMLSKPPGKITLLNVYESMEGPVAFDECLLGKPICGDQGCLLGDLLKTVNNEVRNYFGQTTLGKFNIKTSGAKIEG